jgi:hypothetical protein
MSLANLKATSVLPIVLFTTTATLFALSIYIELFASRLMFTPLIEQSPHFFTECTNLKSTHHALTRPFPVVRGSPAAFGRVHAVESKHSLPRVLQLPNSIKLHLSRFEFVVYAQRELSCRYFLLDQAGLLS